MSAHHHARGGGAVAILNQMDAWEANLVLNLRLWCLGQSGQAQVWAEYKRALPATMAQRACQSFDRLMHTLIRFAHRPLVRHEIGCSCVGSDECILVNLVRTASEGHLNDAALIATLIAGPAQAEHIAILAGDVGECARNAHAGLSELTPETGQNVVRLH